MSKEASRKKELVDNEYIWISRILPECSEGLLHQEKEVLRAETEIAFSKEDLLKLIEIAGKLTPIYNMLRLKEGPTEPELMGMVDILKENGYEVSKKDSE